MKKRLFLLALAVFMLCVFLSSCGKVTVSVEYIASEGGYIGGSASQSKECDEGSSASFSLVSAEASEGYRFIGWSDGKTDKYRIDTLSESASFTALFEKISYSTVTYEADLGGFIEGTPIQRLETGEATLSVTAVPEYGYRFTGWSDGKTEPTRSDIADSDKTIYATFSNKITLNYLAGEGGTVLGNATQEIAFGQSASVVRAIPASGYRFVKWSDGNTSVSRSDEATNDIEVTAIFQKYHLVSFSCDGARGKIIGTAMQEVDEGTSSLPVMANPSEGFVFLCWSNGSTNPVISVKPEQNEYLTAYFTYAGSGLSVIAIDTSTGADVTSKDFYIDCKVTAYDSMGAYHMTEQSAQIRGRGNSTWTQGFPKKPYKIKLDVKRDIFGFGKAKDWVLLADYIDKSLLRNNMAYTVAGMFSKLEASPDCRSVEVYLNGQYHGVYLLCEQVEVNKHRVEVDESVAYLDTGYLVEFDGWSHQTPETEIIVPDQFKSNRGYSVKFPKDEGLTEEHKEFIRDYLTQCMTAIRGTDYDAVCELIDVKSFAQAYIVFDVFKCADTDYSSLYFYKDSGGKLECGPVWDFDMALGNVEHKGNGSFKNPETLWTKDKCPWFNALLNHDEFKALVGKELHENEQMIRSTVAEIVAYATEHSASYEKNFEKWQTLGQDTWTSPDYITAITTWKGQLDFAISYFEESLDFMLEYYPDTTQ